MTYYGDIFSRELSFFGSIPVLPGWDDFEWLKLIRIRGIKIGSSSPEALKCQLLCLHRIFQLLHLNLSFEILFFLSKVKSGRNQGVSSCTYPVVACIQRAMLWHSERLAVLSHSELTRSCCCARGWALLCPGSLACPSLCLVCVQWFLVMGQSSSDAAAAGSYLNIFYSLRFPFNPSILYLCCCGKGTGFGKGEGNFIFANPCPIITNLYLFTSVTMTEWTAITSKKFQCERE